MGHRIFPHIANNRFFNFAGEKKPRFLLGTCASYISWYWKVQRHQDHITSRSWIHSPQKAYDTHGAKITWIGHASFLIRINGLTLLTDPVFFNLPLFRRISAPGIELDSLGNIDYVVISHNHYDHMNGQTIRWLVNRYPHIKFLVPFGNKQWFMRNATNQVDEYMWWDETIIGPVDRSVQLSFLPARHWSGRGLFDYNRTLWGSWMISSNKTRIYFAGDTAYGQHFKAIADEYHDIDIALLPIGPCEPDSLMRSSHVSAEEAGQAFLDLNARTFIPMHWGTFYFGLDDFLAPYTRLCRWWQKQQNIKDRVLHTLKLGESYTCDISLEQRKTEPRLINDIGPLP